MKEFRASLLQIKPKLGQVDSNLAMISAGIEQAVNDGSDLVVLPELALTGYFLKDLVPDVAISVDGPEIGLLKQLSRKICITFGFVEVTSDFHFYNSALWLEDGEIIHLHRKVYLPTYGLFDEQRYLARGERFRAFDSKLGRMGLLICEDMWHISAPYLLAMDGATTLVCLSSSPGRGVQGDELGTAASWKSLTAASARFLTCNVLYVNRVGCEDGVTFWGGSHAVSPAGSIIGEAPMLEEASLVVGLTPADLRRERITSPLLRDENLCVTMRELARIDRDRSI